MKTAITYIAFLIMALIPTAFIVWACWLPILVALPAWGLGCVGLAIVLGGAFGLHLENKQRNNQTR